jgi:acyl-homoserine lactone acylase PvdQ
MIVAVSEEKEGEWVDKLNTMCAKAYYDAYEGPNWCEHNVASALLSTKLHLDKNVGSNTAHWKWRNVHVNEYANAPWSLTPLKFIFHRETPIGGNMNAPCVSKYSMYRVGKEMFKSTHTANYKQVVDFGSNLSYMSIDTGSSGNIFSGHYFDLNLKHLRG